MNAPPLARRAGSLGTALSESVQPEVPARRVRRAGLGGGWRYGRMVASELRRLWSLINIALDHGASSGSGWEHPTRTRGQPRRHQASRSARAGDPGGPLGRSFRGTFLPGAAPAGGGPPLAAPRQGGISTNTAAGGGACPTRTPGARQSRVGSLSEGGPPWHGDRGRRGMVTGAAVAW